MTKHVCRAFTLLAFAVLAAGCSWFNAVEEGKIPQGVIFYAGCPVVFYFLDEDGNDLVDESRVDTYPLVFRLHAGEEARSQARESIQSIVQALDGVRTEFFVYNGGSNWFWKDSQEQLCAFQSYMWGKTQNPDFMMYVYAGPGEPDSLQVKYKYLTEADNPKIDGWGVDVISVTYNGVEVLENNENGKVFVTKPSHGKTSVKTGSRN